MNLIRETLKNNDIYYGEDFISNTKSEIAYFEGAKPFMFTSIALHTFLFFGVVEGKIDKEAIEKYSRNSAIYAKKNYKGKPLGDSTGVVSIAIMIGHDVDRSAIDFCRNFKSFHFAIREIPVIYDTSKGQYYTFTRFRFLGFLLRSYYDSTVKTGKRIVKGSILEKV